MQTSVSSKTDISIAPETMTKFYATGRLMGYFSVQYCITLTLTILLYPISKTYVAPILAFIFPLSEASLLKTILILTFVFWLSVAWQIIQYWQAKPQEKSLNTLKKSYPNVSVTKEKRKKLKTH